MTHRPNCPIQEVLFPSYVRLLGLLKDKNTSIARLRKVLFGASTEKTAAVIGSGTESETPPSREDAAATDVPREAESGTAAENGSPASTQWDIVQAQARHLEPVYGELLRQAAQGDVVYNDDTTMKILELMGKRAKEKALAEASVEDRASSNPQDWMPWNYRETLDPVSAPAASAP